MTFEELYAENEKLKKELSLLQTIEKDDFFNFSVDFLCTIFGRRFLQVNPALVKALGYPKSYLLSTNLTEFLHPEDIDLANKKFLQFAKESGKVSEFEVRFRKNNGEYITIAWQAHVNNKRVAYAVGRDVTTNKAIEKALQQSEELFKAIFNSSSYVFVVIDKDMKIMKVNERAKRTSYIFFGYHLKIGNNVLEVVQADKKTEFEARLRTVLQGNIEIFERNVKDRFSGTEYWFQITLTPLYIDHQIEGICYAAVDITLQKQQEKEIQLRLVKESELLEDLSTRNEELFQMLEELKATEEGLIVSEQKAKNAEAEALATKERIEHILNNIDDHYFWVINPHQLKLVYISHNATRFVQGYEDTLLDNLITNWQQLILPADLPQVMAWQQKVLQGENLPAAFRIYNGLGEVRWFHTFPKAFYDTAGTLTHIEGVSIDVTDAKEAEFALQESELAYRTIFEQAQVGIIKLDFDFNFIMWNRKVLEILKITHEEAGNYGARNFYHPEFAHLSEMMLNKVLSGEIEEYTQERKFLRLNGEEFWTLISVSMVKDLHHKPLHILCVIQDISDLKDTQNLLEQKKKDLDSFFYNVSHALRSPLTTILGVYGLALLEQQPTNYLQYFELIKKTTKKLLRLLDNLTRISEIHKQALEVEVINFQDMIHKTTELFHKLPNFQAIIWEIDINLDIPFTTHPALIQLIFEKLIENSILYAHPFIPPKIAIKVTHTSTHLQIVVKDNGQGILESELPHLANIFRRANENSRGAGLGLYAVKNALEVLHGTISFESKVGFGTTITMMLPLKK